MHCSLINQKSSFSWKWLLYSRDKIWSSVNLKQGSKWSLLPLVSRKSIAWRFLHPMDKGLPFVAALTMPPQGMSLLPKNLPGSATDLPKACRESAMKRTAISSGYTCISSQITEPHQKDPVKITITPNTDPLPIYELLLRGWWWLKEIYFIHFLLLIPFEPGTFLLWGNSTNHCATVTPWRFI